MDWYVDGNIYPTPDHVSFKSTSLFNHKIYSLGILFSAMFTTSCHRHLEDTIMFGRGMNCLSVSVCCWSVEDKQLNRKKVSIFSIKFQNWMMFLYMKQFIYSDQIHSGPSIVNFSENYDVFQKHYSIIFLEEGFNTVRCKVLVKQ